MLEDVGADHQIILAERGEFVLVDVDFAKWSICDFRQKQVFLISEGYLASLLHQGAAKNTVPASQVQSRSSFPQTRPTLLYPADCIQRLQLIKNGIIPMLHVAGNQLVQNHP